MSGTRIEGSALQRDVVGPLRSTELFSSLSQDAAERLARHLVRRRYRRDEVLFHLGDAGDRLHLIESGRVKIGLASEDGREGTLTLLGPTDVFGELVLLDGAPRSATATAIEPTVTLTLDRPTFRGLIDDDAEIRDAVLVGLARWLRRVTDQVADLHFLDLRGRVCSALLRLAGDDALDTGTPIELPAITQAQLAALAAGTRQRISVTLAELVDDRTIEYDGKTITVLDFGRLERAAGR